ncbi:DUF3846 domain-containing protein [Trichormus variabilis]|uniref:DUF3846 domain-containing protein n=1 Tax=Trichormus variabilis SAG 1403-4b TaxID=447716 RepID=A0A433UGC1_ANAVA|nr:DUF3846 domain-containing protein [Trichormus variabilis]MBD2629650.1 DUF3846 domain-containing protein [Trichormus variabilis FACHB-164]RUS92933.1 hypothetical protein DSM107003_46800 [Trichormus variabilis SAG 1403-4b]
MATLINSSGLEEEIVLESLEQIQELVDGYFEQINVEGGLLMINEDGIAKNLPLNDKASALAQQPIRGNVIFTTHAEVAS